MRTRRRFMDIAAGELALIPFLRAYPLGQKYARCGYVLLLVCARAGILLRRGKDRGRSRFFRPGESDLFWLSLRYSENFSSAPAAVTRSEMQEFPLHYARAAATDG